MCHLIAPRHTRFAIGRSPDCAVATCLDTHALHMGAATLYMLTGKPLKNISLPTMQTKEKVSCGSKVYTRQPYTQFR